MANRPSVLFIGGYGIQGGQVPKIVSMDAIFQTPLQDFGDRDLMRILPDDPAHGGTETASGWLPWFHGHGGTQYTATGATATSLTLAGTPWTGQNLTGQSVIILNDNAVGLRRVTTVTSNTDSTINFANLGFTPSATVGFSVGSGRMEHYHAARGYVNLKEANPFGLGEFGSPSFRGGSAWNAGGIGLGPDATAMREFYDKVWNADPWFFASKYAITSSMIGTLANSPNDSGRASAAAHIAAVEAAAAAESDTCAWELAYVDFVQEDIAFGVGDPVAFLLWATRAAEFISWLRTECGNPDMKVIFQMPDEAYYAATGPGGALYMRGAIKQLVRDTDNVGFVDMRGAARGKADFTGVPGHSRPEDELTQYSVPAVLDLGRKIVAEYQRLDAGAPVAAAGGFPLYVMVGDSIITGEIELDWVQAANSAELSGPGAGTNTLRPSNQKIWPSSGVLEIYDPSTNANTIQSVTTTSGPELSAMAELGELHPTGFALLKIGSSGSGLASTAGAYSGSPGGPGVGGTWLEADNQNFTILKEQVALCQQYINDVLGQQADMRGWMVSLGHNDHAVDPDGGNDFANNIEPWILNVWELFRTRTSGKDFPIAWRRPQSTTTGVNPTRMAQVRAAIEAMDKKYAQFRLVDVDGLETDREDGLHESPIMAVETGRRLVKVMRSLSV